ncbi:hypothetical protein BSKO_07792 [Bryopsis sp. KO-2023]|nr:hypothetical protein BSKO_07792 [Bryopsis sp. KO-2023]
MWRQFSKKSVLHRCLVELWSTWRVEHTLAYSRPVSLTRGYFGEGFCNVRRGEETWPKRSVRRFGNGEAAAAENDRYVGDSSDDSERRRPSSGNSARDGDVLPYLDLPLLELLETPQEDGETVKLASFDRARDTVRAMIARKRPVNDRALHRLIKKAISRREMDDVFDVLEKNRLVRYVGGKRVPYTYDIASDVFDHAVKVQGERYVIKNLMRFHEGQLPISRWRLRPLVKYCAFERPEDVRKIWQYAKISNLGNELGGEAVCVLRVFLDNDMIKEAQEFRDTELRPNKVRLTGSEALRKSIYFTLDEKARWIKSKSFVAKKGDEAKNKTGGISHTLTPEEHKNQPAWMDFAQNR